MLGLALTAAAVAGGAVVLDRVADAQEAASEARYPPTGRILDLAGTHVHAQTMGDGPDLVLIHGASGNTRDFSFGLMQRLAVHYRVTAFDRPGLGWTGRSHPRYARAFSASAESPAEQAALLEQAADMLGITRPIVLGHSYGGAVALAWGLTRPEDTAALVVVSAASNPWPGGLGPMYRVIGSGIGGGLIVPFVTALNPYHRLEATLDSIFAPDPVPHGYARHIGAGLTLRRDSFRANARQVNGLRPHLVEMSARYSTLPMPVEIVHGTADTVVPLSIHSEPLARQVPGAHLTRLDGVGHMPHHARPETVVLAIHRAAVRAGLRPAP